MKKKSRGIDRTSPPSIGRDLVIGPCLATIQALNDLMDTNEPSPIQALIERHR